MAGSKNYQEELVFPHESAAGIWTSETARFLGMNCLWCKTVTCALCTQYLYQQACCVLGVCVWGGGEGLMLWSHCYGCVCVLFAHMEKIHQIMLLDKQHFWHFICPSSWPLQWPLSPCRTRRPPCRQKKCIIIIYHPAYTIKIKQRLFGPPRSSCIGDGSM